MRGQLDDMIKQSESSIPATKPRHFCRPCHFPMKDIDQTESAVIFVHDGINSVADYNSLRVGVGWMSDGCRMSVCHAANFTMG